MASNLFKVVITPAVYDEMESIYSFYLDVSADEEIASKVVGSIWGAIQKLNYMPNRHSFFNDSILKEKKVRKLVVGNFIIPFTINENRNTVFVHHVYHSKMDYEKYLESVFARRRDDDAAISNGL